MASTFLGLKKGNLTPVNLEIEARKCRPELVLVAEEKLLKDHKR